MTLINTRMFQPEVENYCKDFSDKKKNKWLNIATAAFETNQDKDKAIRIANSSLFIKSRENDTSLINSKVLFESLAIESGTTVFEGNTIKNARIIKVGKSKNNKYYSKEALTTLVPFLKEAKVMFVNHRIEKYGRDLSDLIAVMESIWQDEKTGDLYCNIKILGNPKYRWLVEAVKENISVLGLSIFAFLEGYEDDTGTIIVERFIGAHSVDWVYNAGAGGGFVFESSLDGLLFNSDEFLVAMESIGDTEIDMSKALENFSKYAKTNEVRSLFYWFEDYITWYCLYASDENGDLPMEQKIILIETAFLEFKNMFIETLKESSYWKEYVQSEVKESFEEQEKLLFENSNFKKVITNIKLVLENKLKELQVKPEELKSLKDKNPDFELIQKFGIAEATEAFINDRKNLTEEITKLKFLEEKNISLEAEKVALIGEKTALETELSTYKTQETEAKRALEAQNRKELISKTMEESKVAIESIPAIVLTKMESIELYNDEDVYTTIKSFISAVETTETNKMETKKGKTIAEINRTLIGDKVK